MGLLAEERQQRILQKLRIGGRVRVSELARELKVTEVTVRRDLESMQAGRGYWIETTVDCTWDIGDNAAAASE